MQNILSTTTAALCIGLGLSGCSIFMASHRQAFRCDPKIIQPGADRRHIDQACGVPNMTANLDAGKVKAIYEIDPNAVTATTRGIEIGTDVVFDIFSIGLWEAVATPAEVASTDKITYYVVIYTKDGKVDTVTAEK